MTSRATGAEEGQGTGWGGRGVGGGSATGKEAASSNTFLGHHRKCTFRGCKNAF